MTTSICRCEAALGLADAASDVIETWDNGDLAAAVQVLDDALKAFNLVYPARGDCCPPVGSFCAGIKLTPDRVARFREAMVIVRPGGCNPAGIAHAVIDACRQVLLEGGAPASDPAVRLMVTQLAWVCSADNADSEAYGALMAECSRRVQAAANEPTGVPSGP